MMLGRDVVCERLLTPACRVSQSRTCAAGLCDACGAIADPNWVLGVPRSRVIMPWAGRSGISLPLGDIAGLHDIALSVCRLRPRHGLRGRVPGSEAAERVPYRQRHDQPLAGRWVLVQWDTK